MAWPAGLLHGQADTMATRFKMLDYSRLQVDSVAIHSGIDLYEWGERKVIRSGEMLENGVPHPFACVASKEVAVVVQFRSWEKDSVLAIWAEGNYGAFDPHLVSFEPVEGTNERVGRDTFWFKPPPAVDKEYLVWRWRANGWEPFDTTQTRMFVILGQPNSPNAIPYVELLEHACVWARGAMDHATAARGITGGLKVLNGTTGNISYNAVFDDLADLPYARGTGSFFSIEELTSGASQLHFSMDYFLQALNAPGVNVKVICYDMAALLNLSLRSIGINGAEIGTIGNWKWPYEQREYYNPCKFFRSNPLHPIGNFLNYSNFPHPKEHYSKAPNLYFVETAFSSHAFIMVDGLVFDPTFDLLPDNPNAAMLEYGKLREDEYIPLMVAHSPSKHEPPFCGPKDVPQGSMAQGGIELLRFPGGEYPRLFPVDSSAFLASLLNGDTQGLMVESYPRIHPPAIVHTFYDSSDGNLRRLASLAFGDSEETIYQPPTSTSHYFGSWGTSGIIQRSGGLHRSGQVGDVGFDVYGEESTNDRFRTLAFWKAAATRGNALERDTLSQAQLRRASDSMLPETVLRNNFVRVDLPIAWQQRYFLNFYSSGGSFYLMGEDVYFHPETAGQHEVRCHVMTSSWVGEMSKEVNVVRR